MGVEKLKTDADVAVYLRNVEIALAGLSREKGIKISLYIQDGYSHVVFGDYNHVTTDGKTEKYYYRPFGEEHTVEEWREVTPQEIRFGAPPEGGKKDADSSGD